MPGAGPLRKGIAGLPDRLTRVCPIQAPQQIRAARRQAVDLAIALGLEAELLDLVALLTGELGSNLVSHAQGGELLIRALHQDGRPGLEVLSVDRGPGMHNVLLCLQDGFSTAGTLGTGLGVARRISDEFDLYSVPGQGTVVMSRIWKKGALSRKAAFDSGSILTDPNPQTPMRGRILTRRDDEWTLSWPEPRLLPGLLEDAFFPEPDPAHSTAGAADRQFLILEDGFLDPTWDAQVCPEVLTRHPAVLAGLLYREHAPSHGRMALRVLARGA